MEMALEANMSANNAGKLLHDRAPQAHYHSHQVRR